jgi:hypothetical protein
MGLSTDNREEGKRRALRVIVTGKEKLPVHARERRRRCFRRRPWMAAEARRPAHCHRISWRDDVADLQVAASRELGDL